MSEEIVLKGGLEPSNEGYELATVVTARLCEYISEDASFQYNTLIPYTLYGQYGKFDFAHSYLIPAIIHKLYQAAGEVMDYTGEFVHDLCKPVGMARKLVCDERQKIWGWKAKSSLHEGIEKTYQFYLRDLVVEI